MRLSRWSNGPLVRQRKLRQEINYTLYLQQIFHGLETRTIKTFEEKVSFETGVSRDKNVPLVPQASLAVVRNIFSAPKTTASCTVGNVPFSSNAKMSAAFSLRKS